MEQLLRRGRAGDHPRHPVLPPEGRGWSDIGYNVVADKYGRLWQARDGKLEKAVIGAHVAGHNSGTFGISVLGTYNGSAPPKKTRDAVAAAIAWKFSLNGLTASKSTLVGHRDLGSTDCPGDAFYAKLGEIRKHRQLDPQVRRPALGREDRVA
ncbi:N-acetylmuramoyl-L-alanine amidase [Brevibacterium casei]|nr:N-acetylmuramoyl-L-alanine amidase [Brevibacterium casei]